MGQWVARPLRNRSDRPTTRGGRAPAPHGSQGEGSYPLKGIKLRYPVRMVRRHLAAAAVLAVVLFVLLAPAALAAPPPHQYYNNGNHGQGWGRDPCDKPKHVPDYCQQA